MINEYSVIDQSDTQIGNLIKNIGLYKNNPSGIQRVILNHLSDIKNGEIQIVDPTNPFVFLLEASCVNTAAAIIENEANNRKQYPSVAQTVEDLYLHMSDKDYVNRFATPAKTKFSILFNKAEILGKMIEDVNTGIKKITIPRNTEFTVASTVFSLQYPVDIKLMVHGGIEITYDVSVVSPLQELSSNIVFWETRTPVGFTDEWIYMEVDVTQFTVNSYNAGITSATGYSQDIDITDSYYYTRAYYKSGNSTNWTEILTTHTDQVYDIYNPTAVLKVTAGNLNISIPQIYLNNNTISGTFRVDVYETKGNVNMLLENYSLDAVSVTWKSIDENEKTPYTEVVNSLAHVIVYSSKVVSGGSNEKNFDILRKQVISNAVGDRQVPITNIQIASKLEEQGYSVVVDTDIITNRIFLATKNLPSPINTNLITAGASSINTLNISINDAISFNGVKNNNQRITLTPSLIYKYSNGIVTPVAKSEIEIINASTIDKRLAKLNNTNYLFTPFHYVLDTTGSEFEIRPYYLDSPEVASLTFVGQNDTTGYQVSTNQYSISKTDNGYKLHLVLTSNEAYKTIPDNQCQFYLFYKPSNESTNCYLEGSQIFIGTDGERVVEFNLNTNFDLDSDDNLLQTSFKMYDLSSRDLVSSLLQSFNILFTTTVATENTWQYNAIDSNVPFLAPVTAKAITQESIKVRFGYSLSTLWARARSVASAAPFKTHNVDIPLIYEEDVYLIDPITKTKFTVNPVNGELIYNVIHRAGDPVLDDKGNAIYKYRTGDVVLDNNGNPITESNSTIVRQIDLMFIEGSYYFATDSVAKTYVQTMIDTVVSWLSNDLVNIENKLLEQTNIYFYPKTTMGLIDVKTGNDNIIKIEASQSFNVELYVSDAVYKNAVLKNALTINTIKQIDSIVSNKQISMSNLTNALAQSYGNDVINVKVTGLGGDNNFSALTVVNNGERCSIKKKLTALADGNLIVQEDVTVTFIKHTVA